MASDTRERILDAALTLFADKGYEGTNLPEIPTSCDELVDMTMKMIDFNGASLRPRAGKRNRSDRKNKSMHRIFCKYIRYPHLLIGRYNSSGMDKSVKNRLKMHFQGTII